MVLTSSQARIHQAALQLFAERGSSDITVSELAEAAGVARGTIYNNGLEPDTLFEDIASQMSNEMNARIIKTLEGEEDLAIRLSQGVRMYIRRAHEEPSWGLFLCKFSFSNKALMDLWTGAESPLIEIMKGIQSQRFALRHEQILSSISLIAGSVLTSIFLVLEGHKTWRDIGTEVTELLLISLGIPAEEAYDIARMELLELKPL